MSAAMAELPLAFFTTLAPIGAGAFIALALCFYTTALDETQAKRVDLLTLIPLVLTLIGFGASTVHLANPANMLNVAAGIGSSPLSNEVTVGGIFVALAVIYWILAYTGKLTMSARKVFALVVAVAAILFAVFTGLAYMIPTIQSWGTPLNSIQILGYALLGGAALAALIMADVDTATYGKVINGITVIGAVLSIGALAGQMAIVSGMETYIASGAKLVSAALPVVVIAIALMVVGALVTIMAVKKQSKSYATVAVMLAICGVFAARFSFYMIQLSVGLTIS